MVLLNSCVYSLFPIYTNDTLVYFPELVGRWEMQGDEDYIEFSNLPTEKDIFGGSTETESSESKTTRNYRVVIMDDGEEKDYVGHIAEIGKDFFLDLYPNTRDYDATLYSNLMPVHTFIKLKFLDNQLYLTSFDLEKLNKLFESNLIRLRHEKVDGSILITAQPKEIQKFIDRYSDDETVFEDKETYKRAS